MRAHGFTLIELAIVLAVSALLAGLAWPAMQSRWIAVRRLDATHSLERLQWAQARHRAVHGLYGRELAALDVPALSAEGLYRIELREATGDGYLAVARVRAGSAQAADSACSEITLRVEQGFATPGPDRHCWNR